MKNDRFYRVNDKIKFSPVVVIDAEGNNLGSLLLSKARELAIAKNLDLVEVSPGSRPPVCRIMDFGKFKFEQERKEKKQKQSQKQFQMKEIRLSCGIAEHDIETKCKSAIKFLQHKHKVQIRLEIKRREHAEIGYAVINKFLDKLSDVCVVTKKPSSEGRFLFCLVDPK